MTAPRAGAEPVAVNLEARKESNDEADIRETIPTRANRGADCGADSSAVIGNVCNVRPGMAGLMDNLISGPGDNRLRGAASGGVANVDSTVATSSVSRRRDTMPKAAETLLSQPTCDTMPEAACDTLCPRCLATVLSQML